MSLIVAVNAFIIGFWYGPENPSAGALTLSFSVTFTYLSRYIVRALFEVDICMTSIQRL